MKNLLGLMLLMGAGTALADGAEQFDGYVANQPRQFRELAAANLKLSAGDYGRRTAEVSKAIDLEQASAATAEQFITLTDESQAALAEPPARAELDATVTKTDADGHVAVIKNNGQVTEYDRSGRPIARTHVNQYIQQEAAELERLARAEQRQRPVAAFNPELGHSPAVAPPELRPTIKITVPKHEK